MPHVSCGGMVGGRQRWALIVSVILLAGTIVIVPAVRTPILRTAGWALVVDEPVERADVIVVAIDALDAGLLEAADLVHSGIATRVALFADAPDAVDREFIRRGAPYEDDAARSVRLLRSMGVETIEHLPVTVAGTEDQGQVLHDWCVQQGFRSIVVVTSTDHSRRLRRVLRRAMKGQPTRVMIRSARHSEFDPDRWWDNRAGIRTGIEEFQKLLLDVVRHPIS
jgi:hypothetical protein